MLVKLEKKSYIDQALLLFVIIVILKPLMKIQGVAEREEIL